MPTTLDQLVVKLEADVRGLKAGLSQAGSDIQRFDKQATKSADSVSRSIRGIGLAAASAAATIATIQIGKSLFSAAVQMEGLNGKMLAAVGSSKDAAQSMQFLREESERLGLRFTTTADSFGSFAAAATRAGLTLQQTKDIFVGVSEASVALRLSNEKINLVFQALSQMASKGTVSMEELRGQLGEALPIAMDAAARGMGVTQSHLIAMISAGEVAAKDFLPAFGKAVRENLGEAVEASSGSAQAGLNRLMNSVDNLKATVAQGKFIDDLTRAFESLTVALSDPAIADGLSGIAGMLGDITVAATKAISALGGVYAAASRKIEGGFGLFDPKQLQAVRDAKKGGAQGYEGVVGSVEAKDAASKIDWSKIGGGMGSVGSSGGLLTSDTSQYQEPKIAAPTEQIKLLKETLGQKFEAEQKYRDTTLEAEAAHNEALAQVRQREVDADAQRQQQLEDMKKTLREGGYTAAMGILQMFASKNKAIAIAMIAIEKARAIASVLIAGQEAGMKAAAALASNPPAAAAAYAHFVGLSRVSAGLIAAQGFAQAAMSAGGGGSGGEGGSSFTGDYNASTEGPKAAPTNRYVNITLNGQTRYSQDEIRALIGQMNDAMQDGTVLLVNGASA